MTHNVRCANANPTSKCVCSCKGKYHGINYSIKTNVKFFTVDKYMKDEKND